MLDAAPKSMNPDPKHLSVAEPMLLLPEAEVVEHVYDVAGVVLILLTEVFQYPDFLLCLPVESLLVSHLRKKIIHLYFYLIKVRYCFRSRKFNLQ
jgi:hypothetical protein